MGLNGGTGKARGRSLGFPRVWVCRELLEGKKPLPEIRQTKRRCRFEAVMNLALDVLS